MGSEAAKILAGAGGKVGHRNSYWAAKFKFAILSTQEYGRAGAEHVPGVFFGVGIVVGRPGAAARCPPSPARSARTNSNMH